MSFMTMVVIGCSFVGVSALVFAVATMFRPAKEGVVEDRLAMLTGMKQVAATVAKPTLLTTPLDDTRSFADRLLTKFGGIKFFFEQADSPLDASKILLITGGLFAVGCVVPVAARLPLMVAPVAGLGLAPLPFVYLYFRRKRRLAQFQKQLPEALELISRALRAGHSLGAGFSLVGSEMADPIGKEFARAFEEQNFGVALEESLENMTERVPNLDLRFFATAVILQRQTGGDLAEILDKIGRLIRERFQIWGAIQALTGEGRLSGIVLLALPPVLFVAMYRLNPEYCTPLFTDPMGHQMLAYAIVMQIIGALVIKKIINIKV